VPTCGHAYKRKWRTRDVRAWFGSEPVLVCFLGINIMNKLRPSILLRHVRAIESRLADVNIWSVFLKFLKAIVYQLSNQLKY